MYITIFFLWKTLIIQFFIFITELKFSIPKIIFAHKNEPCFHPVKAFPKFTTLFNPPHIDAISRIVKGL